MSSNPLNVPLPAQAKAVLAGTIAGLSALLPLMPDGFQWSDLVATLIAGLIGYGAVFGMPNTPPPGGAQYDPADGPDLDDEAGYTGRRRDVDPGAVLGRPADTDPNL